MIIARVVEECELAVQVSCLGMGGEVVSLGDFLGLQMRENRIPMNK